MTCTKRMDCRVKPGNDQSGYGTPDIECGKRELAMKVTCVGTDPAGLYLGILLKRRDPSHVVRFVDNGPQASAPATIICNPLKPRLTLADTETLEAIKPAIVSLDHVSID